MVRFRYTFRFKIALIVFLSTIVTILLSWVISEKFIERWYVAHTKASLVETYNSCNEFFQSDDNIRRLNNETISSLYGYVENNSGATIFVINPFEFNVYSSIKVNDRTIRSSRILLMMLFQVLITKVTSLTLWVSLIMASI